MPVMNGPVGCEELLGRELTPPPLLLPGCDVVPPLPEDTGTPLLLVELPESPPELEPGWSEDEPEDDVVDDDAVTSPLLLEEVASPASTGLLAPMHHPCGQVSPA